MQQIIGTLSKEFVILVVVALVISIPLAWYFMSDWLSGYAYRISLLVASFVFGVAVAMFIALTMISFQIVKAALANPSERLRYSKPMPGYSCR